MNCLLSFIDTKEYKLVVLSFLHGIIHGGMIIFPVVLDSLRAEFGWSLYFAGWVAALGYALFGLTAFPSGWIADRVRRKVLLVVMALGIGVGLLLMAFSPGSAVLISGWAMVGLFAGMYHPLGLSVIAGTFTEKTGRAMAWHGIGGNITLAFTPILVGMAASAYNWRAAFLCGALAALLGALLILPAGESKRPEKSADPPAALPPWGQLVVLLVAYCLGGFIYRGTVTFIPHSIAVQWGAKLETAGVGSLTTLVILLGIFGQFTGGRIAEKVDFWSLYLSQIFIYSLILLILPFLSGWFFIAGLVLWGMVYYSTQPVRNSFLARFGDRRSHGRLYGLAFMASFGLGSAGAGISGMLADFTGLFGMFWGLAGVSLVTLVILYFNRTNPHHP